MSSVSILVVRGSHYELGHQMGVRYKEEIAYYYDHCGELSQYEDYIRTQQGNKFCEELWDVARTRFPHYVDELRGMSDGSGIDIQKVMLLSIERELEVQLKLLEKKFGEVPPKGCTDILVSSKDQVLIGHNEDWSSDMQGKDCIVVAHVLPYTAENGKQYPEEKFIAHTWPGLLTGLASGFNQHGLFYTIDHMYPKSTQSYRKTADLFLCRHLLSASTVAEAQQILTDAGWGAAVGFSANIGMFGNNALLNLEVGLNRDKAESLLSCSEVNSSESNPGVAAHFNNFECLEVDAFALEHCIGRRKRFEELQKPHDVKSLQNTIGDYGCADPSDNIYQDPSAGFPWATIATVIFNVKDGLMLFYRGSSKDRKPIVTLPFAMLQNL